MKNGLNVEDIFASIVIKTRFDYTVYYYCLRNVANAQDHFYIPVVPTQGA